ncbi:antitoxin [Kitasatospora sp. NPDC059648]|uniref:antitoxin n=1 Tax=Kitasatospora sp. NPDC059648 TaxID=3346894 RepID=UPI0036B94118
MLGSPKNLADKATDLAREHSEVLGQGLEKVGDVVDDRTDGKYSGQIDTGVEKAKDFLRHLDGEQKPAGQGRKSLPRGTVDRTAIELDDGRTGRGRQR